MYLCSTIAGNKCGVIPSPKVMFNDHYECIIYAYGYSLNLMAGFERDWVNEMGTHTKFTCIPEQII